MSFSVQDTGPGINEEDRTLLFERFYHVKAGLDSDASGTGLGLVIVKQVIECHQGGIEVGSNIEEYGAVFTVWLPGKHEQEIA